MNSTIKSLELIKELIEMQLESGIEDGFVYNEDLKLYRNLITDVLNHDGCQCDHYVGYDCGCGNRREIYLDALEEIRNLI